MPLFRKKLLSFEDFDGSFNNNNQVHKTLVCFNIGDETPLWKHWGFAYNNPNSDHAEQIILHELHTFLGADQSKMSLKYKLNLYASYSPCFSCCKELCHFLLIYENQIHMHLKVAKLYKFYDSNNQRGLQMLRENGAKITVMDLDDYKECFYFFVSPTDTFQPCTHLNDCSYGNATLESSRAVNVFPLAISILAGGKETRNILLPTVARIYHRQQNVPYVITL
uniref:CMP/dCMP-type deaminase domain-containing protein n=1 Tax=Xenopus tropicalis TaxID=8364 RepID=A0A6I8QZQ1_XENTR